jgi:hypothetical protein
LRSATDDFNPSNKLGEGGFGPVFKVKYIIMSFNIFTPPFYDTISNHLKCG